VGSAASAAVELAHNALVTNVRNAATDLLVLISRLPI
jgi:hypothetical protein